MPYKDKEIQKEAQKQHYLKNKEKYALQSKIARDRKKAKLDEIKKTLSCEVCGKNHPAILDFHHNDPKTKEITIANAMCNWGWQRILNEIEKCRVLCANCYRILHWEQRN